MKAYAIAGMLACSMISYAAAYPCGTVPIAAGEELISAAGWWVDADTPSLLVRVTSPTGPKASTAVSKLTIISPGNGCSVLATFPVSGAPINTMTTMALGGFLLVESGTGSGHLVQVYGYSKGKVQQLLDTGSKDLPDVVRQVGNNLAFALIVRDDSEGVAARGSTRDTATVYLFSSQGTFKRNVVPWQDRFELLK
jgi:hypothetical protein